MVTERPEARASALLVFRRATEHLSRGNDVSWEGHRRWAALI